MLPEKELCKQTERKKESYISMAKMASETGWEMTGNNVSHLGEQQTKINININQNVPWAFDYFVNPEIFVWKIAYQQFQT